jgi:hypothetical protein
MKSTLRVLVLIEFLLAATSLQYPPLSLADHEQPNGGLSPAFSSSSADAWRPNANAGYPGSDLPPSAYNPDAPRYGARSKTDTTPPLDNGLYSGRSVVETPNGRMVCGRPDYAGRVECQ